MRGANQHLSGEEIEQLTSIAPDAAVGALEGAMRHLERCEQCRFRMLLSEQDLSRAAVKMGAGGSKAANSDCPPEGRWLEVAAGLGTKEERKRHLEHAAVCARCGPLLKQAVEDVGMELTQEEETKVAALASAQPKWQSNLAQKIADSAPPKEPVPEKPAGSKRKFVFWPRWAAAFATLVVAVGGGWWAWILLRVPSVEELLAQAYTEQRTLELRISNAKYGPMHVHRGSETSRMSRPSALLDAEAAISHKLASQPESSYLLQMRGRADLLDWKYDSAIETFKHARDLEPNSMSLQMDLASAYFERAEDTNRPFDYGQAMELLEQVLEKNPDDPVALFNHAIISDRMFMYHQSIEDSEHYLRVDPQGSWAQEARQRLEDVRKAVEEYDHSVSEPLLQPEFVKQAISATDESTWVSIDERIEDYLRLAVTTWLPSAFPKSDQSEGSAPAADARIALSRLATILKKRHQDPWLADMNVGQNEPAWSAAIANLAAAVRYNEVGKADEARTEAEKAAKMFKSAGSEVGYMRADLELAYALHRSSQGEACLRVVNSVLPSASSRHYGWIESQALLEESVCSNMANNLERLETSLGKALSLSHDRGYLGLYLRALGFSATEKWSVKGDPAGAWAQDRHGLSYFWKGTFPWVRAYNFYQDLAAASEIAGLRQVALSLRRETVSIDAKLNDDTRHAIARFMLAKAAAGAGRTKESEEEFSLAQQAFDRLPQTPSNEAYRVYSNIQLAQLEGEQGQFEQAFEFLDRVRPSLPSLHNTPNEADFYRVLGEVNRRKGQNGDAEAAFRIAIGLVKASLTSVRSEADRHSMLRTVSNSYRGLVELRLAARKPQEALEIWEEYRGWGSRAPHPTSQSDTVSVMAATNDSNVTTIVYAALNDSIAMWALGSKDFAWASVKVDPLELEQQTRRFNEQCSDPKSSIDGLRRNAARLYQLLIHPVESHLRAGTTLVIETDSFLNQVPIEALVNETGKYLVDEFPIVYSPGLQRYQNLRRDEGITRDTAALIVDPRVSDATSNDLLPLAGSAREAELVRSSFSRVQVLNGPSATWAALKKDLPTTGIFHFAGHGAASAGQNVIMLASSTGSALDAVGPTRLTTLDMRSLHLAVLSACSTGRTDEDGVADANSLVGVFLQANVPHVIAARWNVDSAVTGEFMETLYRTLLQGKLPGRAVQLAALNLRHNSTTAHPYFWAGFSAFGRN